MVRKALALLWWRVFALTSLLLGFIGIFVPGLPTVPFLLLAAWAGSRGWPALEARVLAHPRYGPLVRQWRERGSVPRRAKWAASVMMIASAAVMALVGTPRWLLGTIVAIMVVVATWLWRRPES